MRMTEIVMEFMALTMQGALLGVGIGSVVWGICGAARLWWQTWLLPRRIREVWADFQTRRAARHHIRRAYGVASLSQAEAKADRQSDTTRARSRCRELNVSAQINRRFNSKENA